MPSGSDVSVKTSALRLLVLAPSQRDLAQAPLFPHFLERLTGSKPPADVTSFAGYTSHPTLKLRTKYYSADVGIWCDEFPASMPLSRRPKTTENDHDANQIADADPGFDLDSSDGSLNARPSAVEQPQSLSSWQEQMLSVSASEVRAVIGGIVLLLPTELSSKSHSRSTMVQSCMPYIETVHALREAIEDESPGRDTASLIVLQCSRAISATNRAQSEKTVETLEDSCLSEGYLGWDIVSWNTTQSASNQADQADTNELDTIDDSTNNGFGEKTGIARALEVLEAIDWTASPSFDLDEDNVFDDDDDLGAFESPETIPRSALNLKTNEMGVASLDAELQREMLELKMSMLNPDSPPSRTSSFPNLDSNNIQAISHETGIGDFEDGNEESQINAFPALLDRVVAIREAGAEMSKDDRERFARREVERIMREMG